MSREELISEAKRLAEENIRLKNELSHLWENVKIMITKVSHEFKTPLNSIIGFGELMKMKRSGEYIDNVLLSANHMLELVQSLIDVVRFQYDGLKLSYSIFDSKEVMEEVILSFPKEKVNYILIEKTICADYTRFKQLVYNLISNACKFNKNNKPTEVISYMENNNFCFEVTDYGDGISEENKEKIFEFFYQVSDNIYRKERGSGIGLSLCKAITEAHKGEITLTSELGEGTTFKVKLPVDLNKK